MKKHSYQIFAVLGLLILAGLIKNSFDFYKQYQVFKIRAALKSPQIDVPVIPNEAIVVLTGEGKRIPAAMDLLRSRKSPMLIISGAYRGTPLIDLINSQAGSSTNAQEIWEKIVLESKSTSTIENAKESGKLLKQYAIDRVILVTSDFHMNRSLILFKRIAPWVEYFPYAVAYEVDDLESVSMVLLEYFKSVLLKYYFYYLLEPLQK